jgi:type IV pilus assembly protein PilP
MSLKPSSLLRFSLLGTLILLLSGCGEGLSDLEKYVNDIRAKPPGRIEPIPEFQPYQNFEYTSHDLRDPFKMVDFRRPELNEEDLSKLANGLRPDIGRVREPLEDFPLDTLRLKGTIDDKDGVKWGLIFAPDNTIHRVIEGNHMGQNHGRIISVSDQTIELTEIVPDGLGKYIERASAVTLIE